MNRPRFICRTLQVGASVVNCLSSMRDLEKLPVVGLLVLVSNLDDATIDCDDLLSLDILRNLIGNSCNVFLPFRRLCHC